jgi:hypothetical protein
MTERLKTYRTILYANSVYVEDIAAVSKEAAEAHMRKLWEECSITADGTAEEITSIEADEIDPPAPIAQTPEVCG